MVFKRRLRADEQADFILMALRGMRNDNIHNTKCAIRMLRNMLRSPAADLVRASKAVQLTHKYLEHITDIEARREVFRYLCLLGGVYPEEVVKTLLGCSLQCDNTSTAMWRYLTSTSDLTMKILTALQSVLLEPPLNPTSQATKAALNPLAATSALYEIMRHPTVTCKEALKEIYPTLSIALLCQISYTMHFMPKEIEIYWRTCIQQKTPTPLVPFRSALRTFNLLLRCASHGDQVLIMNKRRGSELLLNPSTHQKGLYLFARAMIRNEDCASILPYLLKTLENPEDFRHITVMTFLVELLRHQTFNYITEYQIIRQLWKQLNATKVELRSLALDGMLQLAAYPEKMAKLEPALPDILARLKESNRAVNVKALKVLRYLLKSLESQEVSPLTLEVANQVIPLFDDASYKVRLAAICAFNCLFEIIKNEEKDMKELAMQSLVPLMVHLFDGSPQVVQASQEGLKKVDAFLKSFVQMTIHEKNAWDYCISLLKRYRKQGERILVEQAFAYLENPQLSLREASIKLLETIAMGSKSKETLSNIATALNLVKREPEQNSTDLIPQIMEALARESSSETVPTSCWGRLKKFWRR
ncbi:uncharacterized protein LOC132574381 [Heteronotia binoei]|uniref:uncharacterized protein LOC132574381 n=1 Tax=Heteronotia binoei TaxID=13085 RepID=UPI002930F341|nr:uncharacterized protein LOC132574381 [Heteronotia binoei]